MNCRNIERYDFIQYHVQLNQTSNCHTTRCGYIYIISNIPISGPPCCRANSFTTRSQTRYNPITDANLGIWTEQLNWSSSIANWTASYLENIRMFDRSSPNQMPDNAGGIDKTYKREDRLVLSLSNPEAITATISFCRNRCANLVHNRTSALYVSYHNRVITTETPHSD